MKQFRQGSFAIFKGKEYSMSFYSNVGWGLNGKEEDKLLGFVKGQEYSPFHFGYFLPINPDQVESAYQVQTWAKYMGYNFYIFGYKEEDNTVALEPDVSINNYTLDLLFGQHPLSPHETFAPWVKVDDLEEIWEVRSPVEGFNYIGPEKVYLKEKKQ